MPDLNLPSNRHELADHLERLAGIERSRRPEGMEVGAELAALLPCVLGTERVVVAVWTHDDASVYRLLNAAGDYILDTARLRDALILTATVEAVEDVLDPLRLRETMDLLIGWQESVSGSSSDALTAASDAQAAVTTQLWAGVELLQQLEQEVGSRDEEDPRLAEASRLDALSALVVRLEAAWSALEAATARWAQDVHLAEPELVQQLITAIGSARRGVLAEPLANVVERGRRAGEALADEVLSGATAD